MNRRDGLQIPTYLAETAARRGGDGARWLAGLPHLIERVEREWSIAVESPYEPGGGASWTAPCTRTADGERLVLKIGLRHPESLHEADGLRVWNGDGTVRLYDMWHDEETTALLLEQCEPGTELRSDVSELDQDVVVAELLGRLWIEPPAGHPFRPLSDMCELWAVECEERAERRSVADLGLVRDGLAVWRELGSSSDHPTLLVTDLHGGNILASQREPWLVVDPKPYVGDRTYDPMQHMTNCPSRLAAYPIALCNRMASLTGVDATRLRQWMFARLIVDSGWPFGITTPPTNYDVARALAS